ncbi:hypothetical protein [Cytobacillus oceanisediminis]|jgi:hypothetical protein|nr:hypothetical protein [Cytobacillus oceanisediminis]
MKRTVKQKELASMKKWAGAAIAYLALVMAGYTIYDGFFAEPAQEQHETENHKVNEDAE